MKIYNLKRKIYKSNNLTFYCRKLSTDKEEKSWLKANRRQELMKMRADISDTEKNKTVEKVT